MTAPRTPPLTSLPLPWEHGPGGALAILGRVTVKSLAASAFDSIAKAFASAAGSAASWLWSQLGAATAVSLGGPGFDRLLGLTLGIAVVVGMGLFAIQIITSVLRRDGGGLARALRGLLIAFLGGAGAIAVTNLLLAAVDALSNGVVEAATGGSVSHLGTSILAGGAVLTGTALAADPALLLILGAVLLGAILCIWAALMVRKVLIVVAAVFAPLAFAGALADISTSWVRRWIEGMAALIVSKLFLVLMLVIGYDMLIENVGGARVGAVASSSEALTQVAAGALVLALAAFAPFVALRTIHFAGDHFATLHGHATSTGAGVSSVLAAPQKLRNLTGSSGGAGPAGPTGPTGPPSRSDPTGVPGGGGAPGSPGPGVPPSAPGPRSTSGDAGSGGPVASGGGASGGRPGGGVAGSASPVGAPVGGVPGGAGLGGTTDPGGIPAERAGTSPPVPTGASVGETPSTTPRVVPSAAGVPPAPERAPWTPGAPPAAPAPSGTQRVAPPPQPPTPPPVPPRAN